MKTDLRGFLENRQTPFDDHILDGYKTPRHYDGRIRFDVMIDLSYVKGIWHSQYAGRTWSQLVAGETVGDSVPLKRLDQCLKDLEKTPKYYLSKARKCNWSFYEVDGIYYVICGNHRTVVARYFLEMNGLDPVIYGVTVTSVPTDVWKQAQEQGA